MVGVLSLKNQNEQFSPEDQRWMQRALSSARQAYDEQEVPVGAVIVENNDLLSVARNASVVAHNPCAHAEILAIEEACAKKKNQRLNGCTLYVTLEPCSMCAGAIIHARIGRVVFGAFDKRVGAAGSVFHVLGDPRNYHHPEIVGGCLSEDSLSLLGSFFSERR